MDYENINRIEFDYNGKHYCLEYTPDTLSRMEASGFVLEECATKPNLRIPQLWDGAFLAHESRVSATIRKKIYDEFKEEELFKTLYAMYNNVSSQLLGNQEGEEGVGERKWKALP